MKRTVSFKTLGCRLNQYETDALASKFDKAGYKIVDFSEQADICVINTCTVTNQSDHKSRNVINQAIRRNNPMVVVTGCMANHFKKELDDQEQISYVITNEQKSSLLSVVEAHFKGEIFVQDNSARNIFDYEVAEKSFHTRCMIKVQDGCDNFCSFCIIPMVRGRAVSRPFNDILENIRKAYSLGYKEVVITGVNIGRYQFDNVNFEKLIEKILEIEGDFRVRISSIEPDDFSDRFIDLLGHPKMCPHLHLCLQSGSDRILLQMRRTYSRNGYMNIVEKIKNRYPSFNFTTDVIVGFPGESDEDFEATCSIVRQAAFGHVHIFPYSVRSGTRAARMNDQVPYKVKQLRSKILEDIVMENKIHYRRSFVGKNQRVLVEKVVANTIKGYGEHYLPVQIENGNVKQNTFCNALITGINTRKEPYLKGKIIE